jgi:hypothetical protein
LCKHNGFFSKQIDVNILMMNKYFNNTRTIEDKRTQREIAEELKKQTELLEQILAALKG